MPERRRLIGEAIKSLSELYNSDKVAVFERERLLRLLDRIEANLLNIQNCGHEECDLGLCTHPLTDVRQLKNALERTRQE